MRISPNNASAVVGILDVPEADQRVGIAHHQARMLKADERDEEANAAGHGSVQLVRNSAQDHLADARSGERQEDDSGNKHRAQGRLPGNVHLDADGVGEIGIEAHARRQRDGIARHDAHQDGAERRRQAGGGGDGGQRQSGIGQDGRVHQHDVGHGQKRRDPGQDLGAPVGTQMTEFKIAFELLKHRRVPLEDHRRAAVQSDLSGRTRVERFDPQRGYCQRRCNDPWASESH